MNLSGIRTFLTIVQTKNLTKASQLLYVTPSTISYRLKTLERELGVELVERSKGATQVRLTPSGENFVKLAERWSLLWQETNVFSKSGAQVNLNISAPASLSVNFLVPLYRGLYRHEPRMRIRVCTQHTEEAVESVMRREMDIAFIGRDIPTPSTVTVRPFVDEDMVLLTPGRREDGGEPIAIGDLDPEYEIYWNWGTAYEAWHDQHWDPAYPRRVQVDMAHLIPTLMTDKRGWTIVVRSLGELFARTHGFRVQELLEPPDRRVYYKVTHNHPSLSTTDGLAVLERYLASIYGDLRASNFEEHREAGAG